MGVTDGDWFRFLSTRAPATLDEVNFWQPAPHGFKALSPGEVFLFKLHFPDHAIVGGGFFAGYSILRCSYVKPRPRSSDRLIDSSMSSS